MPTSPNSQNVDEPTLRPLSWRLPDGTPMRSDPAKERCYDAHILRVAQHLKERLSPVSWHRQRAESSPGYWLELARGEPNILPGNPYQI